MDIWFGVEKERGDKVQGENEGDESGVDVPVSEYPLKLRVKLLEHGSRVNRHCCRRGEWSDGPFLVSSNPEKSIRARRSALRFPYASAVSMEDGMQTEICDSKLGLRLNYLSYYNVDD